MKNNIFFAIFKLFFDNFLYFMKNHDKYKNYSQYKLHFSQFILTIVKNHSQIITKYSKTLPFVN
ncbi:hypothetical protein SAMN05428975_1460 [Mucilaginibacter sp. OK268]|nr:hypothetical protein SAMN05428975_1460 [Mucilaginibacter sp. OK268]